MTSESDEQPTPPPWEGLEPVAEFPSAASAHEHALVALAMGESCCVVPTGQSHEFSLLVETAAVGKIHDELVQYADEQSQPAPKPLAMREIFRFPAGWDAVGLWVFSLLMVFYWQSRDPSIVDRAASSGVGLFRNGEWWRPFTSLFLHADLQHLLGNILSGTLFGTLVSRSLGAWRGWALILASGVLGNILTCLLTLPEPFVSIGASTAVFGALGILSGIGLSSMRRSGPHLPLARTTAPLIAGIVLLGWLGVGQPGDNTDVLGHVMGFCSGLAAGLICERMTPAANVENHPTAQAQIK